jgi:hypothetical protein
VYGRWPIQRKAAGPDPGEPAGDRGGGGAPLPGDVRAKMERSFGVDFSDVRVHTGGAESMGALAYASGSDVYFAAGRYDPHGATGQELLGHELAHVVQQRAGRVSTPQGKGAPIVGDEGLEAEADRAGAAAARGEPAGLTASGRPTARGPIQRKVGFEMQSTWQIVRIGKNMAPDSKAVAYAGLYFDIEVDAGDKKPELEIVTHPLRNRADVEAAIDEIRYIVGQIVAGAKSGRNFTLGPGNGWVDEVEIKPMAAQPTFRLQFTEGVTLEKIPAMIQQLHQDAWDAMPDAITGNKAGKAPAETKLRGLEAAICMYLSDAVGYQPANPDDGPKYAFALMARTDFHSMYAALDPREQTQFGDAIDPKKNKTFLGYDFKARVFASVDPKTHEWAKLTVGQWLQSIVNGRPEMIYDWGTGSVGPTGGAEAKDLMSPPPGYDQHGTIDAYNKHIKDNKLKDDPQMKYAMGMYGMDGNLALFEDRDAGSSQGDLLETAVGRIHDILDEEGGVGERDKSFANPDVGTRKRRKKTGVDPGGKGALGGNKFKKGGDYAPSQQQVERLNVHHAKLVWINPDGFCIFASLGAVLGRDPKTIHAQVVNALKTDPATRALFPFGGYSLADVTNCVENILGAWGTPVADVVLELCCVVLGAGVTVLQPDGTPIPIHGGGPLLVRVEHPNAHYFATAPL